MTDCYKCGVELTEDNSYPSSRRTTVERFQVCKPCHKGSKGSPSGSQALVQAGSQPTPRARAKAVVQAGSQAVVQPTLTHPGSQPLTHPGSPSGSKGFPTSYKRLTTPTAHNPDPLTAEDREALEEVKRIRRTGTWHRMVVEDEQNTALVTPYDQPEEEVVVVDPYRPNKKNTDDEGSQDTD